MAILAILSGIGTILTGLGVGAFSLATRVVTDSTGNVTSSSSGAAVWALLVLFTILGLLQFVVAYSFLVGAG